MTRRELLLLGAGLLGGCRRGDERRITGSFVGASHEIGHLLRGGSIPSPSREKRVPVVIVGAGIAGLSAGWKLSREGFHDFEILELENEAGGNARSGENQISAYPWGAHYVPLPTKESRLVRQLFEELGIITGYDGRHEPIYKDEYLCFDPQERLYIHGRWQEGLLPTLGASQQDHDDFERFRDIIDTYKSREKFTIPMELSSRDDDLLRLDLMSMSGFLKDRGLDSPALHWYRRPLDKTDTAVPAHRSSDSRRAACAASLHSNIAPRYSAAGWPRARLRPAARSCAQTARAAGSRPPWRATRASRHRP